MTARAAPWLVMGRGGMFLRNIQTANNTEIEEIIELPTPHFVSRTDMLEQQIADRDKMITMLEKDVEFLRGL